MSVAKPRRILGYVRVSSLEQALGTSLQDQEDAIRAYAKATHKADLFKVYTEAESGTRANQEHREKIKALLAEVRPGDLVLCDKLDRWSRDTEYTLRTVREILERGASFFAVAERCDPATNEGRLMLTIRAALATEEASRIKQRLVGTRNILQSKGYFAAGVPPRGYRRPTEDEINNRLDKNVLVIVPEEAELVRSIFKRYVAGESTIKLAAAFGVHLDFVKKTLHQRIYLGEVQLPPSTARKKDGGWIKGKHAPIIDRDLFQRAQDALVRNRLGGSRPHGDAARTHDWILRDVARCVHCGAKMTSAYAKRRNGDHAFYYRCRDKCQSQAKGVKAKANVQSHVPVYAFEANAVGAIEARIEAIREVLAKPHVEPKTKKPKATDPKAQRAALDAKRERLLEQNADGHITREQLRERMAKVDGELSKLDAQEEAATKPSPLADPKVRQAMLADLRELGRAFAGLSGPEMRQIVNVLVERVGVAKDEEPVWTWRPAEDVKERLDVVRDSLVAGLGRAPTHAELLEQLTHGMAEAYVPPSSRPPVVAPKKTKGSAKKSAAKKARR